MNLPGAATRLVALLGDPVDHSLSPAIQNAAFQHAGLDGVYVALRCDLTAFPGLLRGIAAAGGAGNVTVPHKRAAASLLDERTATVERTGACNTFWAEAGRLCGDNTDVEGFRLAVRELVGSISSARVLLLGAGGAARAALLGLLQERADSVTIHNRTTTTANQLRDLFRQSGHVQVLASLESARNDEFDLVVNATRLGMKPDDPIPLAFDRVRRIGAVLDLAYAPDTTAWVRTARLRGIRSADGIAMLIHQAAAAFRCWWGIDPSMTVMRSAVDGG